MSDYNETTGLLIQYLDGELPEADRIELEQKIAADNALQKELLQLKLARQAVRSYGLKEKVSTIHQEMMMEHGHKGYTKPAPVRSLTRYIMRVAAVLLVVLASAAIYQYVTLSPEHLFSDIYRPYEVAVTRGDAALDEITAAFRANKPQDAIALFEKKSAPSADDYFIAGNAYLQLHQPAKSILAFTSLQNINLQQGTHQYEEDIAFYLGMAYLENHEVSKALELLKPISTNNQHAYHDRVSSWQIKKLELLSKK